MKSRRTTLKLPVLEGYDLRLLVSTDLVATGKRVGEREDLSCAAGAFCSDDERPGIGWLVLPPNADAKLISHECLHAVWAIFKHHGCKVSDEEQVAHWQGYLAGRVTKFLRKKS